MTVRSDPEENETHALLNLIGSLTTRQVLEIGCGDGRLTWRYADATGHITAIEPDTERIQQAQSACPASLRKRVEFHNLNLEQYAAQVHSAPFDLAILAWSL
ncbi:MAG: class I SAM-dependent methyltransferase [Anaerolineales bacterium]|jgi:tRNA1(Val) A37 N6-methylase TrmN6